MSKTECPYCYQEYEAVALAEGPDRLHLRAQLQAGKIASMHLYTRNPEGENVCWGMHKAIDLPAAPVGDTKIANFSKCPECEDSSQPLRFFGVFDLSEPVQGKLLSKVIDQDDESEPGSFSNDTDYHSYLLVLNDHMTGDEWFCNKPESG